MELEEMDRGPCWLGPAVGPEVRGEPLRSGPDILMWIIRNSLVLSGQAGQALLDLQESGLSLASPLGITAKHLYFRWHLLSACFIIK